MSCKEQLRALGLSSLEKQAERQLTYSLQLPEEGKGRGRC